MLYIFYWMTSMSNTSDLPVPAIQSCNHSRKLRRKITNVPSKKLTGKFEIINAVMTLST